MIGVTSEQGRDQEVSKHDSGKVLQHQQQFPDPKAGVTHPILGVTVVRETARHAMASQSVVHHRFETILFRYKSCFDLFFRWTRLSSKELLVCIGEFLPAGFSSSRERESEQARE